MNEIIKSEKIPKMDREVFVNKLDAFLSRMTSADKKMKFLGVRDEADFRRLNFMLDKYNVNRKTKAESFGARPGGVSQKAVHLYGAQSNRVPGGSP